MLEQRRAPAEFSGETIDKHLKITKYASDSDPQKRPTPKERFMKYEEKRNKITNNQDDMAMRGNYV